MLSYLKQHSSLPVPSLRHADDRLLVMDYIPHDGRGGESAQQALADHLARLHGVTAPRFGLERDTLIGSLPQSNPWTESWLAFFREQRLLPLLKLASERGALGAEDRRALGRLAERLEDFLEEPETPALLHGDCWSGNVLFDRGGVAGFIDPAIYYGHPEIELAFGTLFGPFGDGFFARYREQRAIAPGFFELRRDLYNLYPLLVHATLFGGGYGASAGRIARRLV
jgi:fructosamine-3-kinase